MPTSGARSGTRPSRSERGAGTGATGPLALRCGHFTHDEQWVASGPSGKLYRCPDGCGLVRAGAKPKGRPSRPKSLSPRGGRVTQLELELHSTIAMRRGDSRVDQCAECGALVCHHAKKLGACPACGGTTWWRQTVPEHGGHISGPFHVKPKDAA